MGEPAPAPAELSSADQPAASLPAGFLEIPPEFLDNKFFHTPSPSKNRFVHIRPSRGPVFMVDATSSTGDVEHLYACHPSKMHDELFDSQGRRRFAFPLGVSPPGLDREIRAESVAIGIRTTRTRSKNRHILTLQTVQETLPENIFDEQRPQLSDYELGIKAFGMRVNLFDNQKSVFLHSLEHTRVFDPPRTEYLFETWHSSWPERTQIFYRRNLPQFKQETAQRLYDAHESSAVSPQDWQNLVNQTIKESFPDREFPDLPAQWPKGVLPFQHKRSFVKATLLDNYVSIQKGGCPISGDAVNIWNRFREVKEDPEKQTIRVSPQEFAVKIPPNCGIQVHPQSIDIRLVNKNATPCDSKFDFPLRHQPFLAADEKQLTDLQNIGKLTIPLTREPTQRVFEIVPPAVLATFDTTIPMDVTPVAVPPPGGPVGNEFEPVHRLRDNEGRIWEVYDKDEKFSFSKEKDERGKPEPTHLGVLMCHKGHPYVFLRSKSNNNHWRQAYAEEFASGKLFTTLKDQVKMRDNREWVRSDGSPWPVRFPLDGGIPFVSPKQQPPVPSPPALQPPAQQPVPAVQPVVAKAASPSAGSDLGSKASPAAPSPNLYFRRTSRYIFVDPKRIFDEFDDALDFSELTQTTPVQKEYSQPVSTNARSREGERSRSPRGGDPQRLRPPPDMAARAKSAVRTPPHSEPGTRPKFPSPPAPRKGDSPRDKKGDSSPGKGKGKGDHSPKGKGGKADSGKGKMPSKDTGGKLMAPVVDPSALGLRGQLQQPPRAPFGQFGTGNITMPTGLASTGGFPVASMGVTFSSSAFPTGQDFRNVFAGKGGSQFGPPVGWRPPPGPYGGLPPRPIPPVGPPPNVLPPASGSVGQFSAGPMVPGVRPTFTASGFSSSVPSLPAGPPPSVSSSAAFLSPAISETSTLNALTTPTDMRDQSILTMGDGPDDLHMPSPALNPAFPTPPVGPSVPAVRAKASNTITLSSATSSSGPSFAANVPNVQTAYKNKAPPPPPPKPKPPPAPKPGGHAFGPVDPRDRDAQQ